VLRDLALTDIRDLPEWKVLVSKFLGGL